MSQIEKKVADVLKFPLEKVKTSSKPIDASKFLHLVEKVARKMIRRLPRTVELNELISCGYFGLVDAMEKFDESKGASFNTYAEYRIRGAILDELRRMDWVPRGHRQKARLIEKAKEESRLQNNSNQMEGAARILNMNAEEFSQLRSKYEKKEKQTYDENYLVPGQVIALNNVSVSDRKYNPSLWSNFSSTSRYIKNLLESLSDHEQKIVECYYFEHMNLKEISGQLGLTESRISQLHMQAKLKLKDWLQGEYSCSEDLCA
jgi:RNA polymerase sigma factor for flagellar operon FliA